MVLSRYHLLKKYDDYESDYNNVLGGLWSRCLLFIQHVWAVLSLAVMTVRERRTSEL